MRTRPTHCALALLLLGFVFLPGASRAGEGPAVKVSFTKEITPLLNKYCTGCHGGKKKTAGLALDAFKSEGDALDKKPLWEKVLKNLQSSDMPPARKPQPTAAEKALLVRWLTGDVLTVDCGLTKKDPGHVTLRRLNRAEYNNTIRDLFGLDLRPADDFPADDLGYGFDNIGDVLSLPPVLLEKYLAAAEKIVTTAVIDDPAVRDLPDCHKRIVIAVPTPTVTTEAAAQKVLAAFVRRAFRRPARPEEISRFVALVKLAEAQGDRYERGVQLALQAILVSPSFLFRVELDPRATDKDAVPLNEFHLASRLSYFLWSSMPDDELFEQAKIGTLRQNLDAQVRRMLRDPKAQALTENFAGQWLQLRNLRTATPDPERFGRFDDELRTAMQRETELFFETVVHEDRSVLDFLDADFTFLNERLAKHYGIPGVRGSEFRRVPLTDGVRGGVLTHASVLTVTSNPTRTSPVKRGKWILENILGTPPPPPPPGAGELSDDKDAELTGSLRQRMEQHRAKPLCASCHERMDPLGFGLENFDAVGRWREKDGKFAIDPSGILPGGKTFQGPKELKAIVKGQKELFCRCLAEKMLTYALGRGLEYYDKCAVDKIVEATAKKDFKFSSLVSEIVRSDPFQMRRK